MRIAVYGATGAIGSSIVAEATNRGHDVTGISRRGGSVATEDLTGDALDADFAASVAEKHDVVVSAIGPSRTEDDGTRFVDSIATLVETLGEIRVAGGGADPAEVPRAVMRQGVNGKSVADGVV